MELKTNLDNHGAKLCRKNFTNSPSSQIQVIDLPAAGDSTSEEENPRNTPQHTRRGRPRLYRQGARPKDYVQETWSFLCEMMSIHFHLCPFLYMRTL